MKLRKTCPQCGGGNHSRRKRCTECGHVFWGHLDKLSAGYHTPCLPATGAAAPPPQTPEPAPVALCSESAMDQFHDAMLAHRKREIDQLKNVNARLRAVIEHTNALSRDYGLPRRDRTMKRDAIILPGIFTLLFLLAQLAKGVTLEWDPSPDAWVAGYAIHHGTASSNYTVRVDVGTNLTATITNLTAGTTYYFIATAYTADGQESLPSNEVAYTVPYPRPEPPGTLRIPAEVQFSATVNGPWTGVGFVRLVIAPPEHSFFPTNAMTSSTYDLINIRGFDCPTNARLVVPPMPPVTP